MSALSTREAALASALEPVMREWGVRSRHSGWSDKETQHFAAKHAARTLVESGAVIDASILADDEALVDVAARAVLHRWPADEPITREDREQIRHAFRALADALTRRGEDQ